MRLPVELLVRGANGEADKGGQQGAPVLCSAHERGPAALAEMRAILARACPGERQTADGGLSTLPVQGKLATPAVAEQA